MNERIKDMWEEATGSTWPRPGKFTPGEYDYHLKKFAQLIVEQCAAIIESQDVDPSFKLRMSWAVKQYFGVEE